MGRSLGRSLGVLGWSLEANLCPENRNRHYGKSTPKQRKNRSQIGSKIDSKSARNWCQNGRKSIPNRPQTGSKSVLGGSGGVLGRSLGVLGVPCRLGGIPRGPRVVLGPSWGRPGAVLGLSWAVLGPSWGRLGASRGGPRGLRGRILGCIFLLFPVLACKPFGAAFLSEF